MGERLEALVDELQAGETTVALTGAGVSTASGIPDFRSEGGIWEEIDPSTFHLRTFRRDPNELWQGMLEVHEALPAEPAPNRAHHALARLEGAGYLEAVITQNGDGLHQAAGSDEVVELHGNLQRAVCMDCRHRTALEEVLQEVRERGRSPTCDRCAGLLKPDGVLFGERLPADAYYRAHHLAERCDVFLVAGTSLTVYPAAELPETAVDRGATVAVVNREETPIQHEADFSFQADVTELLPRLTETLEC